MKKGEILPPVYMPAGPRQRHAQAASGEWAPNSTRGWSRNMQCDPVGVPEVVCGRKSMNSHTRELGKTSSARLRGHPLHPEPRALDRPICNRTPLGTHRVRQLPALLARDQRCLHFATFPDSILDAACQTAMCISLSVNGGNRHRLAIPFYPANPNQMVHSRLEDLKNREGSGAKGLVALAARRLQPSWALLLKQLPFI
jgi:hypothetical protein